VAIEAFNRLHLPLVVTGGGPDRRRLRRLAGPTVRFAGRVSDEEAARLLATSRALVVTTGEEFGIAAVEAQAAGRPVIARAAGGLLENVIDGVTGSLWEGGPEELADAVAGCDTAAVDPQACIANAQRFDASVFRESFPREVQAALREGPSERLETWPRIPRRPAAARRPAWRAGRFGPA
jgi:glycosyltransferase involved in cell wall biosynthesis